jgi:hypothetical protein
MDPADIDPQSGCRIPLVGRGDLDTNGQKLFDHYTSSAMLRGLHGPAGIWLHSPKLAELYQPLDAYLRHGSGLSEPVREVCILAIAREFDNSRARSASWPSPVSLTTRSNGRHTKSKRYVSGCRERSLTQSNSGRRAPTLRRHLAPSSS